MTFDDILSEEIESWQGFSDIMRSEDRRLFLQMLNECREYKDAISSKGSFYSSESTLMSLIFIQQKMISELIKNSQRTSAAKNKAENNIERIE
jgi:hypothetical protein